LNIGTPGDRYEQEADHISKRVMDLSGPQLQRAPAAGPEHPRLQTKHVGTSDSGQISAPPIVNEVLTSPGQPLDPASRAFMEPRFGHDFSQVRVHSDQRAAESASAIGASAYTVAPNIVFGAGQFAPHTTAGRMLLAHELTHVIQRQTGDVIRRSPKPGTETNKEDARLKELAEDPNEAHRRWKGLTSLERMGLVVLMTKRYGDEFAKLFVWYTEHPVQVVHQHYGPGFPEHTPEWFQARGYQLWQRSTAIDFWIHPSGKIAMQIRDSKPGTAGPGGDIPPRCPPIENVKEMLDLSLGAIRGDIAEGNSREQELVGQKEAMDKMNFTSDEFKTAYDAYVDELKAGQKRVEEQLDSIDDMETALKEMCGDVAPIETLRPDLEEIRTWFEVTADLLKMEGRVPINPKFKTIKTPI
jgi:hypothetical protein